MIGKTLRYLSFLALSATPILVTPLIAGTSGCVVRSQMRGSTVADTSPPPPRYQNPQPREGYVWIQGHWVNQSGQWTWQEGRWEQSRSNMVWQQGRWEQRSSRWYWIEGQWVQGNVNNETFSDGRGQPVYNGSNQPVYNGSNPPVQNNYNKRSQMQSGQRSTPLAQPTLPPGPRVAPPEARDARPTSTRTGMIWVRGHYFQNPQGQQEWIAGHWRRKRAGQAWRPGHYSWQDDRYQWTEGDWMPEQPGRRWQEGRWTAQGGVYVWIEGSWTR